MHHVFTVCGSDLFAQGLPLTAHPISGRYDVGALATYIECNGDFHRAQYFDIAVLAVLIAAARLCISSS